MLSILHITKGSLCLLSVPLTKQNKKTYGLEVMIYWLNKHQESINSRFSKAFILESIEFILKNNSFKFNYEYFLQLVGTATGTDMAPTYGTITMGYHEVKFYTICEFNWGAAIRQYIEEAWGCFLDDCEILFPMFKCMSYKTTYIITPYPLRQDH